MELRFKAAAVFLILIFSSLPAGGADTETVDGENSSAALEMIAERMKALSGSLAEIPEPPKLNQVIHIPNGSSSEEPVLKKNSKKEI